MSSPIPGMSADAALLPRLRPYLRHCGCSQRPAWRIASRKLLDFLLVYIDRGRGRFAVAGTEWEAADEDLFWIPPDTAHEMEGFAPGMTCTYLHFDLVYRPEISHWDFSIPGGMLDLREFSPLMHPPLPDGALRRLCGRIRSPANAGVAARMHEACAEAAMAQPFTTLRCSAILLEIVALVLRIREGARTSDSHHVPALEEAANHIQKCCLQDLSLAEVARRVRMSASHFRKAFGAYFGCPPRTYLRRARIQKAKQLMMEHRLNLTEIAERCGFATVHSFSRTFRACEGKAPSAYRRFAPHHIRVEGRRPPYAG